MDAHDVTPIGFVGFVAVTGHFQVVLLLSDFKYQYGFCFDFDHFSTQSLSTLAAFWGRPPAAAAMVATVLVLINFNSPHDVNRKWRFGLPVARRATMLPNSDAVWRFRAGRNRGCTSIAPLYHWLGVLPSSSSSSSSLSLPAAVSDVSHVCDALLPCPSGGSSFPVPVPNVFVINSSASFTLFFKCAGAAINFLISGTGHSNNIPVILPAWTPGMLSAPFTSMYNFSPRACTSALSVDSGDEASASTAALAPSSFAALAPASLSTSSSSSTEESGRTGIGKKSSDSAESAFDNGELGTGTLSGKHSAMMASTTSFALSFRALMASDREQFACCMTSSMSSGVPA